MPLDASHHILSVTADGSSAITLLGMGWAARGVIQVVRSWLRRTCGGTDAGQAVSAPQHAIRAPRSLRWAYSRRSATVYRGVDLQVIDRDFAGGSKHANDNDRQAGAARYRQFPAFLKPGGIPFPRAENG